MNPTITTVTTTAVTTAGGGRSGTIHTNDAGQQLYRTMAWNSDHTADELRAIANLIDHQDDDVVDAEIHCHDCGQSILTDLRALVIRMRAQGERDLRDGHSQAGHTRNLEAWNIEAIITEHDDQ